MLEERVVAEEKVVHIRPRSLNDDAAKVPENVIQVHVLPEIGHGKGLDEIPASQKPNLYGHFPAFDVL